MAFYVVHAKFRPSLGAERALRMLCSFEDPLKEALLDEKSVLMTGVVKGSTPEGVAWRVREELEDAGAETLSLYVEAQESHVEDTEGCPKGAEGSEKAA